MTDNTRHRPVPTGNKKNLSQNVNVSAVAGTMYKNSVKAAQLNDFRIQNPKHTLSELTF
jgi:hypothetical protein